MTAKHCICISTIVTLMFCTFCTAILYQFCTDFELPQASLLRRCDNVWLSFINGDLRFVWLHINFTVSRKSDLHDLNCKHVMERPSINDDLRFSAIFDLFNYPVLLYNVRSLGLSWTPTYLILDVINGRSLSINGTMEENRIQASY